MTGPHDSVIGSEDHGALRRFLTGMPTRLEPATGDVRIEGTLVDCTPDGRATACELVRVPVQEGA
jgi:calcineurin-like phosphoesterase